MKKIAMTLSLAAILLVLGFAGSAKAAGGYIGTGLGYSFPSIEPDGMDWDAQAGGFSWEYLHGGYNFTDNFGLSMVFGSATGSGSSHHDDISVDFIDSYLDLNARFTIPLKSIAPYGEFGLGGYVYSASVTEKVGTHHKTYTDTEDAILGYRLAVGAMIPIGNFYLDPEFSYHMVPYSGRSENFGLLLLKFGYAFGK